MTDVAQSLSTFNSQLHDQIQHEFHAHQQYIALGVWFDGQDLPRLAAHFYRQAVEERNHAMMIVRYLVDRGQKVTVPGVDSVRNDFAEPKELVELALEQEKQVTAQFVALAKTARDEGDYIGEQFLQWFLKEQVEEVSQMSTLLHVLERAGDDLLGVETFLARESVGDGGANPDVPKAAGGNL